MCKQTADTKVQLRSNKTKLLLGLNSYHEDEKGEKGPLRPTPLSTCLTVSAVIILFIASEQLHRYVIGTYVRGLHQLFELEENRHILARHIGVDAFACGIVAYLGYIYRHLLSDVIDLNNPSNIKFSALTKRNPDESFRRIYKFYPEGHQVLIYFFAYQIKNLYDSYVWDDGVLFLGHHVMSGAAAWVGMYPGVAQVYSLFFMGMSEISTSVLCVLANFDSEFGVKGLEDVYPMTRAIIGAIFIVAFLLCRVILWPVFTFHFVSDTNVVLEKDAKTITPQMKFAITLLVKLCQALSVLQVVFLGQIIWTIYQEVVNMI